MSDQTTDIQTVFQQIGGAFPASSSSFIAKAKGVKAFIFDWDGVFNDGVKAAGEGSPFSEVDSMGLNMLRFGYYLKYGSIPLIYVVTGENNPPALHLSKREHFDAVYLKSKIKTKALDHILGKIDIQKHEVAFMFDDILDLGLAREVGLRFFVKRPGSPMLDQFVNDNELADYRTGNSSRNNPVREVCELCIASLGNYDEVVELRITNDLKYQQYLEKRNNTKTKYYKFEADQISEFEYS